MRKWSFVIDGASRTETCFLNFEVALLSMGFFLDFKKNCKILVCEIKIKSIFLHLSESDLFCEHR